MDKPPQEKHDFQGFEQSNTTPVPDVLFDELLSKLSGAELKVLLYIIRRTRGFKKDSDAISLSQFQNGIITREGKVLDKGCGIKRRQTIIDTLISLEKKGYIVSQKGKTSQGDDATTVYQIRFRVVSKPDHPSEEGSFKTGLPVVSKPDHGGFKTGPRVVSESDPQETVIQQTDSQQTVIQESSNPSATTTPTFVADATSTHSSQSSLSSSKEPQQKEKHPYKRKKTKTTEPEGPPKMPPPDASWPSRETAVQIVEAKKGRHYSATTRKQELQEAEKLLEMTFENEPITREQFEYTWDQLASSSWWEEHGKPCMIKYLRRDDTIVTILAKRAKNGKSRPTSQSQQSTSSKGYDETSKKNIIRQLARLIEKGLDKDGEYKKKLENYKALPDWQSAIEKAKAQGAAI